ncbi:MAG TPA: hydrogenase maturation protease [Gemmatimonadaceae bacterium]
MSVRTRVIALGQRAAGDDGVGFAVLEELQRRGTPPSVEVLCANDATDLLWLLETSATVVLVDAAVGTSPGQVMALDSTELTLSGVQPISSHGLGVGEVVELARMLAPERVCGEIRIVVITIDRPDRRRMTLSPSVAGAIVRAADRVLELTRE